MSLGKTITILLLLILLAKYISKKKGSGKKHISILKSSLLELYISQEQTVKVKNPAPGACCVPRELQKENETTF